MSPDDPPDSWPSQTGSPYTGGDEREGDGSDRKQKKKKKRRQKDEGSNEHHEGQAQGETSPSAEEFYHRIGPRRDKGEGGWEEQLGRGGGRGKRSKSRKKLPEEWGVGAEPFVPESAVTSQIADEALANLKSSDQDNFDFSISEMDTSQSPWKKDPEEDLCSPVVPSINPLVLNSELSATAAPFSMPSTTNSATLVSFPMASSPGDSSDFLVDTENASLGYSNHALLPPFSSKTEAMDSDMVDSGMFDNSSSLQSFVQGMPQGDTSAVNLIPQSSPGLPPKGEPLASAPPLSPSDALWALNDSQMSSNTDLFDFADVSASGLPVPLGLSFDAPSPPPLRSPKTTVQDSQPKELKDAKAAQKQSKKSHSSTSSPVTSPTSPGGENIPPQASPVINPSSPPSVSPLAVPGSGLNPSAKPFFPSFADTMEETAMVPPFNPITKGWLQLALDKQVYRRTKISIFMHGFYLV